MLSDIKALTFDVFGTVVDWRSGVAREAAQLLDPKGFARDWGVFADRWRARYVPAMERVRKGERPWTILDDLHRENLVGLLAEEGIEGLSEAEIGQLNHAWHRLDPWPDVVEGLTRLKRRFIIATLSNGNVALTVNMAKRAGLPWDVILGAEVARAYKPAPEAYDRAVELLRIAPGQCLMTAAHTYDLDAAATRGLRTAYVHRPLEYGAERSDRARPGPVYDVAVDSFIELADRLGC
ncbi:MAG TPA: haloacid dehalogenase type II [Caulobacteraceae bacterium]